MEDKTGWKADMLMERLRAKQANIRTLQDTSKTLRLALMDKRQTVDAADRAQLQRSLELLQHKVKLHSLQGTLDRLEAIAKQLGMSYRAGPGQSCFIECDMFYVELELHVPSGQVREARLQHEADASPQPCPELAQCLTSGDYQQFTAHLQGLLALYKLNADRKLKARAYPALRALEMDLTRLAQMQAGSGFDTAALIHRSPVGLVQPRRLGQPMRLTYMVTPYHLLDGQQRCLLPLSAETVAARRLGLWAEVLLHSATAHKLQTAALVSVEERSDGQSVHSFAALNSNNSCTLPAAFVLKLSEPMPMSADLLDKMVEVTQIRPAHAVPSALLPLICQTASKQQLDARPDQPLYVKLPDQLHCYYLESSGELSGAMVEALPFTHPAQVAPLLALLRTQALFNTLVASCVRPGRPKGSEASVCLEVTALSVRRLAVAFEHPREDGLACLELELTAGALLPVSCRLQPPAADVDTAVSRVLHRCLSIPVTMRALLRRLRSGRGDGRSEPAAAPGAGGGGAAPDAGDGSGEPPRPGGGGDRAGTAAAMAYEQFQSSMGASFTMNQLQALWPGAAVTGEEKPAAQPGGEPPSGTPHPAKPSGKPAPAPTPPSEMESIEATVRQMERERSRRSDSGRESEHSSPARPEKRPPMDMFSLPGGAAASIPSSLTITAIPSGAGRPGGDADRRRDRRDKERSEKKRRREESPASAGRTEARAGSGRDRAREGGGKPLAMRHGADATASPPSKKHSSSGSGSSPSKSHGSSSSPAAKSASPVPKSKSSSSSGSSSSQQTSSKHPFPSHSPKHSSPRPPSVSPKHSSSPKPPSAGKPSLSSLRSPSPSHQSRSGSSSSAAKGRDRSSSSKEKTKSARPRSERESDAAGGGSRPASLPGCGGAGITSGGSGEPGGGTGGGTESRSPGRGRKGSLSDVISKLNTIASAEEGVAAAKDAVGKDGRRAEFTVKPSSEGIKLTINKTKSRPSSSSPSGMGSRPPSTKEGERVSPSGLKPGATSGPASKKTFAFPKQMSSEGKSPSSVLQNDLVKSMSSKLLKRPDTGGTGVRPKSDRPKLEKSASDLTAAGDLPPLPKSLEIRKIERPTAAEPPADHPAAAGPEVWPPPVSRTGSDTGDVVLDMGSSPCPPPPPRPPPRAAFPPSPSVQIRIVKSPAPVSSPHQLGLVSSPRSVEQQSPCVIDDELMDEALVGLGK